MRFIVLLCFFVSGLCGLIYEVVWIRAAGTVIGNSTYAVGIVVGVFMGGLALGAWAGGRIGDRSTRPLLLYGILEGGVALFALGVHFLLTSNLISGPQALRIVLVGLPLLVPTTLMGATLPILSRFLSDSAASAPREAGRAYALNTLGGAIGTGLSGFLLLPEWGMRATTLLAAGLNVAVGVVAVVASRRTEPKAAEGASFRPARLALAVSCVSGLASLVYEVAWTRALILSFGSTVYAFTVILAAFILGLAAGAALGVRWVSRGRGG
jgi:spermidine synthase